MVMSSGEVPRHGAVHNTISAHDFLALNPGLVERPMGQTGWRIIQSNGLVLPLRPARKDDVPDDVDPDCIGCLDLGYPETTFERVAPPPTQRITWFSPRDPSRYDGGQTGGVDWARPVRQRLAAARIAECDHYSHLKARKRLSSTTWTVVMPFRDDPPPPAPDLPPRGEGGAAHGGSTTVIRGSGASTGRSRNSQASRHHGDADVPPPPASDRHSRGEAGAAHGGSTAVVRGSGVSAGRSRDSAGDLTVLLHARRNAYLLQSRPGTRTRRVLNQPSPRLYPLADPRRRRAMRHRTRTSWRL